MIKPILNKWQSTLSLKRNWATMERGWKIFEFGIFKFIQLPDRGVTIGKEDYKGFIIRFAIWFPFDRV